MATPAQPGLVRSIGRLDLVAATVNAVIGAGIFGLPAKVFGLIGDYSIIAFLVCAVFASLIVICFAEVGSRFSETGGPYLYAREAFGPAAGFETGWLMWLARVSAFAANANLLVGYAAYFWPPVASGAGRNAFLCAVALLLLAINSRPMQAPIMPPNRTVMSTGLQPRNAPIMASNLMSPPPMPSFPKTKGLTHAMK